MAESDNRSEEGGVIVPAFQAMTLVAVQLPAAADGQPTIRRFPIVAWRVYTNGDSPDPVAVGRDSFVANTQFIELPDGGGYLECAHEGALYDDLDEAIRSWRNGLR